MLGDLDGDGVRALANEVHADCVVGDLSEESFVRDMVAQVIQSHGSVDVLVNNAGGGVIRPFLDHDADSLTFGRIVNIGADSVRNGLWDHAGYNAAKGGVHGLTTGLAREFAQTGVTINTVAPCMVGTPLVKEMQAQAAQQCCKGGKSCHS